MIIHGYWEWNIWYFLRNQSRINIYVKPIFETGILFNLNEFSNRVNRWNYMKWMRIWIFFFRRHDILILFLKIIDTEIQSWLSFKYIINIFYWIIRIWKQCSDFFFNMRFESFPSCQIYMLISMQQLTEIQCFIHEEFTVTDIIE